MPLCLQAPFINSRMDFQSVCSTDTNTIFAALSWWRWQIFNEQLFQSRWKTHWGTCRFPTFLIPRFCSQIQIHPVCPMCYRRKQEVKDPVLENQKGGNRGVIKSFFSLALHCWCCLLFNRGYRAQRNRESHEGADCDSRGSASKVFIPYRAGTGVPKPGWILRPELEMIIDLDVQRKTVLWSWKGFQK